jgi:hypothetical protein
MLLAASVRYRRTRSPTFSYKRNVGEDRPGACWHLVEGDAIAADQKKGRGLMSEWGHLDELEDTLGYGDVLALQVGHVLMCSCNLFSADSQREVSLLMMDCTPLLRHGRSGKTR